MYQISRKERLFIDSFDGDSTQAALMAGYTGTHYELTKIGEKLLKDPVIQSAIVERENYLNYSKKLIASRLERQALWTSIMRNEDPHAIQQKDENGIPLPKENIPLQTRLKATELLGKSEADFVDKIDMSVSQSLTHLVEESYKVKQSTEEIEAEYHVLKEQSKQINQTQKIPKILENLI